MYRPAEDTWLLAHALRAERLDGADVLDLCTGSGALAVTAAVAGARVTAVDVSRRAAASARLNLRRHGVRGRVRRGRLFDAVPDGRFDVIVANPPYVPTATVGRAPHGRARGWDAGRDGREVLDRICADAPGRLRAGGRLLVVQSTVADVGRTVDRLRAAGMEVAADVRARIPFGPVMRGREDVLRRRGLLNPGECDEELVVVRAQGADER
ncbi:MAG: HemK2/MTQ2 family protein methyltransferase [Solirubrobacteraceae bacterium]